MTAAMAAKRLAGSRANALLALVFVVAQLLFAAHDPAEAGDFTPHESVDCVFCLAAPQSPDPDALVFEPATPTGAVEALKPVAPATAMTPSICAEGNPRAPPHA